MLAAPRPMWALVPMGCAVVSQAVMLDSRADAEAESSMERTESAFEAEGIRSSAASQAHDQFYPGDTIGELSTGKDCDCLNWAETYYNARAFCGRANELYFLSKNGFNPAYAATEPLTGLPHKVCWDFFANFISNTCVNVDLLPFPRDNNSDKQWCYVSNNCKELNGGKFASNSRGFQNAGWNNLEATPMTSWKYCDATDDLLMGKSVVDVEALGKETDVSLSRLLRLAFPAVEISFAEVAYLFDAVDDLMSNGTTLEISDALAAVQGMSADWDPDLAAKEATMRTIMISGQPTVLDTPGHSDEFHVAEGRAVYEVMRIENGDMAYLGGHFSKEFVVNCLMGCAPATESRREAVDLRTM